MLFRRAASRLYHVTLRAFPHRHRDACAAEMIDTFERELAARERNSVFSVLWFVAAASLNVVSAGLGERRRQRRAGFTGTTGLSWLDFVLACSTGMHLPAIANCG